MRHGRAYLNLSRYCFPNAVVCLDNFHIVNRLNEAMDAARIKEQDRLLSEGHKAASTELKRLNKRLKTALNNQTAKWGTKGQDIPQRILTALERSPELKDTYAMLQYFHGIMHSFFAFEARAKQLDLWIKTFENSKSDIIHSAVKTVKDHLEYIHNAWRNNLSNATCEGNNRIIKAIKNFSFGIHHFSYLRSRALMIGGEPGVDRNRKKKQQASVDQDDIFFYSTFPSLEDYQPACDWSTYPAPIND